MEVFVDKTQALVLLRQVATDITKYYRRTQHEEYTDVGDAWEIMLSSRDDIRRALRVLDPG